MSGIFGVVTSHPESEIETLLRRMADANRLSEWQQTQVWSDQAAGVGLGQANIGLFSHDTQPVFNEDRSLAVVFFGEIYRHAALRQSLLQRGVVLRSDSPAELVLRLYENGEPNPAQLLDGVFTLGIWDAQRGRLTLANGRFGLLPLFYTHFDHALLFSPLVAAFLAHSQFPRRLNLTAAAEFIRFQRLLGDKTYFEDVHLLPYGSWLVYTAASDQLDVRHYWDFDQIPVLPASITFNEAVEQTGLLMRQSVNELTGGDEQIGVYLSGGLDSRTVLGFCASIGKAPPSITYGYPNSTDVLYAHRVARKLGSPHHFFPQPNGKWLLDSVDLHLAATEGFTSFIHAHSANTLAAAREILQVNLTGFNGDQLLGARAIEHALSTAYAPDDLAFFALLYQNLTRDFSWPGPNDAEEKLLFTSDFYPTMSGRAFDSLRNELHAYEKFPTVQRLDYFTTIHQGSRMSNLNVVFARTHFETRYPFCDARLADFVFALPVEFRMHDRLYLAVVNREIPAVTWVPRDTNDLLLTDKKWLRAIHGLGVRIRKQINKRFSQDQLPSQQLHGDPEDWLRDDLREWAAGILFDKRTTERGIFNPLYLRSIYARHMAGHEIWTIGKIAPLITFELMLRRYFD